MAVRLGPLLFFGHPRMASNAVSDALLGAGGMRMGPNHRMVVPSPGQVVCCVVRDPVEVLSSWYTMAPEYDDDVAFVTNYTHGFFAPGGRLFYMAGACRELMRYEHLDVDFERVLTSVGLPPILLERVNVTKRDRRAIGVRAIEAARKRFPLDFLLWEGLCVRYA